MLRMWHVQDVYVQEARCLLCGIYGVLDVWDTVGSRCEMFEIGMFAGAWDLDLQNANVHVEYILYLEVLLKEVNIK